jgi:hypothetical protein
MTVVDASGGRSRNLVLAAMIFAVAMTSSTRPSCPSPLPRSKGSSVSRAPVCNGRSRRTSCRWHAVREAQSISQDQGGSGKIASIPHFVQVDFAYATRNVLHVVAIIMPRRPSWPSSASGEGSKRTSATRNRNRRRVGGRFRVGVTERSVGAATEEG